MLAHVDMDAFYAAVEVLDRPELAGKPLIVGGGKRGVVSAASYEARAFGVRSALPMFQARRLCPQAVVLPGRMARYRQVSRRVMEVLSGFTPALEPVSVDEAYLDLSGTERLWGDPWQAGRAIKEAVRQATGLTCSVGIAPVRFLAKIASDRDKPDGLCVVDDLEAFLATVKVSEVPGVGKRAAARLADMGISRLIDVRPLGPERLEQVMGAFGQNLWQAAQGQGSKRVHTSREIKSLSHEETFEKDVSDRAYLAARLLRLSQKVGRRLRSRGLAGRRVTLKLRHGDFRLVTRSQSLDQASDQTDEIYGAALELLGAYSHRGPFRLIGVGVSGLGRPQEGQGRLFGRTERERSRSRDRVEDRVAERFGEKALFRGSLLGAVDRTGPKKHDGSED